MHSGLLQRKCACGGTPGPTGECEACRKKREAATLQRAASHAAVAQSVPPIVHDALRSAGRPLDRETRAAMEPRFGHDFSNVRIHTDAKAAESARAVGALAYTVGRDVVFGQAHYAPATSAGQKLIAHELTHVVQQASLAWPSGALRVGAADTPQEREAQHAERRDAAAPALPAHPASPAPPGAIQRQPSPDLGGAFLRLREDGRIEVLVSTPNLPVTGPLGGGIRCQSGRCQPVGGQDPSNIEHRTYTVQEALDLLGGRGGATPAPSGTSCPPERVIPQLGACCPVGMMWDGRGCTPLSASLSFCPPTRLAPNGTCCPAGERWDFMARRCAPPAPAGQPGARAPQLTLPQLGLGATFNRFGTIESSTFDSFQPDGATVPARHNAELDHLASLLNIYRDVEVHIEGHTDSTASEAHNEQLSVHRAQAIRAALIARNVVNPSRLRAEGFGERQLRYRPELSAADKAGNRRVEVWFHIPPSEGIGSRSKLRRPFLAAPVEPGL